MGGTTPSGLATSNKICGVGDGGGGGSGGGGGGVSPNPQGIIGRNPQGIIKHKSKPTCLILKA